MEGVAKEGRTVLFVSHNMQAVIRMCERVILLDGGSLLEDGPASHVVTRYLTSGEGNTKVRTWGELSRAPGTEVVRLRAVQAKTEDGKAADTVDISEPLGIEIEYEILQPEHIFHPVFDVRNSEGVLLFAAQDTDATWRRRTRPTGRYISTGWIPGDLLNEGVVYIGVSIWTLYPERCHLYEQDVVTVHVVDSLDENSARGGWPYAVPGAVRPLCKWETHYQDEVNSSAHAANW